MRNTQAEQAVIGSILMDGSLYKDLRLKNKHFADPAHRKIYQAIEEVSEKEQSIDVVTVTTELESDINNVGGVSYLTDLATSIPTTANLKHYESAVFESYRKRKTREYALRYAEDPDDESLHKLLADLETVKEIGVQQQERSAKDYLIEIAEDMAKPPEEAKKGFETGYTDLDKMTGGLQQGDLIIIAARPSVGKTAFALNIASGHCSNGGSSHVFSLEMGTKSLLQRMISSEARIDGQKWRSMSFNHQDYSNAMSAIGIISN